MKSMGSTSTIAIDFCQNCSIKSVSKIIKSTTIPLRVLWTTFFVGMCALFVLCVSHIVVEFLSYDTVIQVQNKLNDKTDFPAVSFCNYFGFGKNATEHWKSDQILSPSSYNTMLRQLMKSQLNASHNITASNIHIAQILLHLDKKEYYYQNLHPDDIERLGHKARDIIKYCVTTSDSFLTLGSLDECELQISTFSHLKYFTCFTIQPPKEMITETSELTLVINIDNHSQSNAFLYDVFNSASGVRMSIHEPGIYTNIDRDGMQIQPGKMVEVSYRPVKNIEVDSPTDVCTKDYDRKVRNMFTTYKYSTEACILEQFGLAIAESCKCYRSTYFIPHLPNTSIPFCGNIFGTLHAADLKRSINNLRGLDVLSDRQRCIGKVDIEQIGKKLRMSKCLPRCTFYTYDLTTSTTLWRPETWQIPLIVEQQVAWSSFVKTGNHSEFARVINEYAEADDISKVKHRDLTAKKLLDRLIYIKIKRLDHTTVVKTEKLQITFAGLFSRLGGLCSLFLGLTCVFVAEVVELLWNCIRKRPFYRKVDNTRPIEETNMV